MSQKYPAEKPRSYSLIESEAQRVRRVLGVEPTETLPGLRLFESLRRYVVTANGKELHLDYAVEHLELGIEAEARYEAESGAIVVSLCPETYSGLEEEQARHRFTVFHEIGHAVLHPSELVRLSRIPRHQAQAALHRGVFENLPPYQDVEWQANAFAAALSMPAEGMERLRREGRLTVTSVAEIFSMSRDAAEIRCRTFSQRRSELLRGCK